jgi:hypothetical protein
MTASDTPKKRPGRKPKPPFVRALRRIRNKGMPASHVMYRPWEPPGGPENVDWAIDESLLRARQLIDRMVIDAVRDDRCEHMGMYLLYRLIDHALQLTRWQRRASRTDAP